MIRALALLAALLLIAAIFFFARFILLGQERDRKIGTRLLQTTLAGALIFFALLILQKLL